LRQVQERAVTREWNRVLGLARLAGRWYVSVLTAFAAGMVW
jgi:hypothetical protein